MPLDPTPGNKCQIAAGQNNPLVTEWPASEKANLEALMHEGAVAVAFTGCKLRVLSQCRLSGSYRWQATTPATDVVEINNEDELYAKLPLGAASLESELKRSGKLSVQTYVAGQLKLQTTGAPSVPESNDCAQATHIVSALSVGAFTLSRGADVNISAGASFASAQAGGAHTRSASLVRSAGDTNACSLGTAESPNANCASPIQAFLWPLPGRAAEEGPPGTVKVDFVSANPANRWEVYADDEVLCSTPCSKWVDPVRPVMMRAREDNFGAPDKVQVPTLAAQASDGPLQLKAHGTARGQLVTGMTFLSLTGMALITGITLTALGCSTDRGGMCTGGLISMGAGAVGGAGALWLMLDALPKAEVVPVNGGMSVFASPAGLSGRF